MVLVIILVLLFGKRIEMVARRRRGVASEKLMFFLDIDGGFPVVLTLWKFIEQHTSDLYFSVHMLYYNERFINILPSVSFLSDQFSPH